MNKYLAQLKAKATGVRVPFEYDFSEVYLSEEMQSQPVPYLERTRYYWEFHIGVMFDATPSEMHHAQEEATLHLLSKLYAPLFQQQHLLRSLIMRGTRQEAVTVLDKILKDIGVP